MAVVSRPDLQEGRRLRKLCLVLCQRGIPINTLYSTFMGVLLPAEALRKEKKKKSTNSLVVSWVIKLFNWIHTAHFTWRVWNRSDMIYQLSFLIFYSEA